MPSIIKVDQIQSDQGFVNVSSNLQFSSGFTMLSPTISSPTLTTPIVTGQATIPTINLTGGQIVFPSTQSASSDPNTLDDYEEGSWTPTFNGGSPVLTANSSAGSYIKIGAMVWIHCQLHFQCTTAGSGAFYISNLPFTAASINGHGFALSLGPLFNWNVDNSAYQIGARVNEGSGNIYFWNNFDATTDSLLAWPFAGGGTQVYGTITGCYRV